MRKPLQIKLEDLRQEQLKELIQVVEKVLLQCKVDFYLLGAIARDAWYVKEQIEYRSTRDVDFAVYISEKKKYDEVLEKLTTNYGFSEIKDEPFRLQTPFTFTIDIIPFGEISLDDAVIPADGTDHPVFVNGFEETFRKATIEVEDDGLVFKVATLPAILMLKLIAYDDRSERRAQDPRDIAHIIENYFEVEKEMIWERHSDLFDEDSKLVEIGARVIGRELNNVLAENTSLKKRVVNIVSLQDETQKKMVEAMAYGELTIEQVESWFKLIKEGILSS